MRIQIWDPENHGTKASREYVEHEIVSNATRDEYDGPEMKARFFYEDVETGLLVADVPAYEKWLATVVTTKPAVEPAPDNGWGL